MKLLRTLVGLLLLAVWLPATSLCLIERVGWVSSDDCCPSNPQSNPDSQPSGEAACCALASATYRADDDQALHVALPMLALVANWIRSPAAESLPLLAPPAPAASPPELLASWQFSCRTALPPRAPSLVS